MPEPGEPKRLSQQEDPFDLDRDDPFDNGRGPANILTRLQIPVMCWPVIAIYTVPFVNYVAPFGMANRVNWIGTRVLVFAHDQCTSVWYLTNLPARGVCKASTTPRQIWLSVVWLNVAKMMCHVFPYEEYYGSTSYFLPGHYMSALINMYPMNHIGMFVSPFFYGYMLWPERKYGTRAFYHRYCCEISPHGRIFRIMYLYMWFTYSDFILLAPLCTLNHWVDAPWAGSLVALIIFGIKRFKFMLQIPFVFDDGPFKNYTFVVHGFNTMYGLGMMVACGACSSATLADAAQFLFIDWILCGFRIAILLRLGQRAFPGLVRFLLAKVLENVPRPMYRGAEAMGDATAMRLNHAYICLLEAVTLSLAFQTVVTWVALGSLWDSTGILAFMNPMGTILLPLSFLVNNVIQDQMCGFVFEKFSNWSFLFRGMFKDRFLPMELWGIAVTSTVGVIMTLVPNLYNRLHGRNFWMFSNYDTKIHVSYSTAMVQN